MAKKSKRAYVRKPVTFLNKVKNAVKRFLRKVKNVLTVR